VAGAIKRVGGREIETEALKQAPVPVGKAVATSAGKLKARYIIHAPSMEKPAMNVGKDNVRLAMTGALNCAEELEIESLAYPGLGTGVGSVSPEEAATIMLSMLGKHIDKGTVLKRVIFVGYSERLADAFKSAMKQILV
jgi:O-acetyl-ADP-ribose deacetylase (regulator of RNase III)